VLIPPVNFSSKKVLLVKYAISLSGVITGKYSSAAVEIAANGKGLKGTGFA
jgi:hypothetical protein